MSDDPPAPDVGDEDEDVDMLEPDHPLMDRPQAVLGKQLRGQFEVLSMKFSEESEELTRAKKLREDVGVQLYQVQQQLAKLQMNLEKVHENQSIIGQMRDSAETDLTRVKSAYTENMAECKEQRTKFERYQGELDQLSATIRQVEAYNEQMKSEIAVTRRATYKAEEAISKLESGKKGQDVLIDNLNEKLKRAQEQLALHEAQLLSQRGESEAAGATLKDANTEMESIQFEKKQLLQQWRAALIGMQRRDEALQATEDALHKQREQEMALESEMAGIKKAVKVEEEKNETLTTNYNKLDAEVRTMDASIEATREKAGKSEEQFAILNRSLEQTDAELDKVNSQQNQLQGELSLLEAQVQKVQLASKKLEDAVMSTLGEQMAVEKGTQNTAHATEKLRSSVQDKEMVAAGLQNELARIKVDTLNVTSHNTQLQVQLKRLNEELKEKDALMAKYQLESRRRNVDIEKKQHDLDLLNRKFDQLMKQRAGMAELDEDSGPLEATIVNMKKEIINKAQECAELQRVWIKMQTELVAVQNKNNAMSEAQHEHRAKLAILEQRRIRIARQFEAEEKEGRDIERTTSALHIEMSKINRLVAEHQAKQVQLADDNFLMETGFVEQLKELEKDAVATETKIIGLKEEKERLLLDVTEAEKQIMLLEKKIALERETQAALDPEVGAAEARAMQREIHRMRLRYAQLQRRQEIMIADMERAIYKRDNIEAKGKVSSEKKGAPPTQAALAKQVGDLTKKLKMTTHDANVTQMQVLKLQEDTRERGATVEAASAQFEEVKGQLKDVEAAVAQQQQQQRAIRLPLATNERIVQKLLAAAEGNYQPTASEMELSEQLQESELVGTKLFDIASYVSSEFSHLAPMITTVVQTARA